MDRVQRRRKIWLDILSFLLERIATENHWKKNLKTKTQTALSGTKSTINGHRKNN